VTDISDGIDGSASSMEADVESSGASDSSGGGDDSTVAKAVSAAGAVPTSLSLDVGA
jgi:hypothetical protein